MEEQLDEAAIMKRAQELTSRKDATGLLKMIADIKKKFPKVNITDLFKCEYCHREIKEYMSCRFKPCTIKFEMQAKAMSMRACLRPLGTPCILEEQPKVL